MKKKALLVLSLMLAVVLMVGTSQAAGPRGQGPGGPAGPPPAPRQINPDDPFFKFFQDTASLRGELMKKHIELQAALAGPKMDEAKVWVLHKDIQKLQSELNDKHLMATIEYKKRNPDWQPGGDGFQGRGHGMGRARHWQGGPGPCWQ